MVQDIEGVVSSLQKLKEELETRVADSIDRARRIIEDVRDDIEKRINELIEVVKMVPIDIFSVDYVGVKEFYIEEGFEHNRHTLYFDDVRVPSKGRYKAILLVKKVGEE